MVQYIYKRMISKPRDVVGNILIIACVLAMLTICIQIGSKLVMIIDAKWLEERLQVVAITDMFIRRKLKAVTGFVFAIICIIYIFGIVLFSMKVKLEIMTERSRIGLFKIVGYKDMQICLPVFLGKSLEIFAAAIVGLLISWGVWELLCNQQVFLNFIKIFDDNVSFQPIWIIVNTLIVIFEAFPVVYLVQRRNVSIMDVKGEE